MAYVECLTRKDLPSYQYLVNLDSVSYTLTFTYNIRMGKWFLQLSDSLGNPLVGQVPITSTFPLFDRFKEQSIPAGTLFAFDSSGQDLDAGRFDLGDRVRLLYAEEGTL